MRLILITIILLLACLAASSPIDQSRLLVNWPSPKLESRVKRSEYYVKDKPTGIKTRSIPTLSPRKGEYWCGDKICKLRPGDRPPCEHCQYPVYLS